MDVADIKNMTFLSILCKHDIFSYTDYRSMQSPQCNACACLCVREQGYRFSDLDPDDLCLYPGLGPDSTVFDTIYQISHKKTCLGPILPHTLATNERWTTSCTMKPLTATSEVAWVIKRGGVLRTIWSLTRSILPLQLPCPCAVHFTCIKVDGRW